MKVLMLGWELPPHNSGGLGVACYQMCKALAKTGVDIEFIVPYTANHDDISFMKVSPAIPKGVKQVQQGGTAYQSYSYRHVYNDGSIEDLGLFEQTEKYIKAIEGFAVLGEFDIIHAHDWLTFRAALRAKELSGKPMVAHIHATEFDRSGGKYGNPLVHEIEQMGLLLADKVFAVSQLTKDLVCNEYGIPEDHVEVVHNSINVDQYNDISKDNDYKYLLKMKQQGYRVVVNVGRITIQKGLYNLLLAAKEVISRRPKTLFLIVGSGDQYLELLQLSADLGIAKNVIFTDFQRGKRLRDSFAIGDLFVMPSVSEPFGLTPLEAIGYGTPALISYQSGVSEILENALKVDFWDVQQMANQIHAVVDHDGLRDELWEQSYQEFNRMTWDHTADKLVSAYHHHAQLVGTR